MYDVVMWCKNGENTLDRVLTRIEEIVPRSSIRQKIITDDNSCDRTVEIAKKHGWDVYQNKGKGISDNANTALELVKTEKFLSFEQDIFLANDWFSKIPPLVRVTLYVPVE